VQLVQQAVGPVHEVRGCGHHHGPLSAQVSFHRGAGQAGLRRARDAGRGCKYSLRTLLIILA
jgi:hypothetical protein